MNEVCEATSTGEVASSMSVVAEGDKLRWQRPVVEIKTCYNGAGQVLLVDQRSLSCYRLELAQYPQIACLVIFR